MKRLNISISNFLPKRKLWLSAGLLFAFTACTDLNETLYDKVSMDDYGKKQSEVATIAGGPMPHFVATEKTHLKAMASSAILRVSMFSSPKSAQAMRLVSLLEVQTGLMAAVISSSSATTGTPGIRVFFPSGVITSRACRR